MNRARMFLLCSLAFVLLAKTPLAGDERERIAAAGMQLERLATSLAAEMFDNFRGWKNEISDQEQFVLFKSEAFAASCRLFGRLAGSSDGYYSSDFLRTNLYNAFMILTKSFQELEEAIRQGGPRPSYALSDCRRGLEEIDRLFSRWPAPDNLAYLDGKYVKANERAVYLIVRKQTGVYVRRPFTNMESLWRYNYGEKRKSDPWKYFLEVERATLEKMAVAEPITLTFEGMMVIDIEQRPNRPVYLIENGKKRFIPSPQIVERYGGWKRVYEIPNEIIAGYADGDPIK